MSYYRTLLRLFSSGRRARKFSFSLLVWLMAALTLNSVVSNTSVLLRFYLSSQQLLLLTIKLPLQVYSSGVNHASSGLSRLPEKLSLTVATEIAENAFFPAIEKKSCWPTSESFAEASKFCQSVTWW